MTAVQLELVPQQGLAAASASAAVIHPAGAHVVDDSVRGEVSDGAALRHLLPQLGATDVGGHRVFHHNHIVRVFVQQRAGLCQ